MTQEMSNAEQEHIQALVHRIAIHIVEGSAAVQELKSTVARLKNQRSDIEYAVYEHWLKAAKIIEAAGKEKSSWEKFIKSLRMTYGSGDRNDDDMIIQSGLSHGEGSGPDGGGEKEEYLLPIASKELWAHEALQDNNNSLQTSTSTTSTIHRFVETNVDSGDGYRFQKQSTIVKKLDSTNERVAIAYDTERLAQVAMTIGEPNYKMSKRKLEESSEFVVGEGSGGGRKKKGFIQFTNGRKVLGDKVQALKRDGRCYYCERKGHRAVECKDNPDIQGKP